MNNKNTTKRVLLVEDTDADRYATKKALSDAGYEVLAATSYMRALELLCGDSPIDLLVTDIVMPSGVNGFALARMARVRRPELKILYLTGYELPMEEALGKVLRKPIDDLQLVSEVNQAFAA
jgi:CheY-like chemotaxis protein